MDSVIQYIVYAAITAFFGFVGGLILWIIRRERYELLYYLIESPPFPLDEEVGRFYDIKLLNSGNKSVKDISYKIIILSGRLKDIKFSDPDLLSQNVHNDNEIVCHIPLLNPNERLETTITVINTRDEFNLEVKARAEEVSAKDGSIEDNWSKKIVYYIPIVLIIVLLGFTTNLFYSYYQQSKITNEIKNISYEPEKIQISIKGLEEALKEQRVELNERLKELELRANEREQGKPEKQHLIFRSLTSADLTNLIPELMLTGEVTYWQTGIFLTCAYSKDKPHGIKYVNAMKELLALPDIAPSSKGFMYYLLSRIERDRGLETEAEHYLNSCREETPLMYEFLMEKDAVFQLGDLC